jgi:hypothetical protein
MTDLDEILEMEEVRWRKMSFTEIVPNLDDVTCYDMKHKGAEYQFEIHTKKGQSNDEIIIMVECSKKSFLGSFFGRCRYFAKAKDESIREIDGDEAF